MTDLTSLKMAGDSLLEPGDDLLHAGVEGDNTWRESYYFGFYDERAGLGGFESFGYRPAKRHSGSMLTLWRPGYVAAALDLGGELTAGNRLYEVGGFVAECLEPYARWRVTYKGRPHQRRDAPLRQPVETLESDPAAARADVSLDCVFHAADWVGEYDRRSSYEHIFSACYEQVGRLTGEIRIDDERIAIDCPGVRHHAWGLRDWFSDDDWNWCTVVLDDGSAAGFWHRSRDGAEEVNGWLHLDGRVESIRSVKRSIATEEAEVKPLPRAVRYDVEDASGRTLELEGEVMQITPAFFRGGPDRSLLHWNDRSLVRFESPRGAGHGEVEFIGVVEDAGA